MHVPDRLDPRRIDLVQHARHLLPAAERVMGLQADGDAVPFSIRRGLRQAGGNQIDHVIHRLALRRPAAKGAHDRHLQVAGQRQIGAQVGQMFGAVVRVRRREAGGRANAGDNQPVLLHQAANGGAALSRQVRRNNLAVQYADFQPGVTVGDRLLRSAFQRPARRAKCAEYKRVGIRQSFVILSA